MKQTERIASLWIPLGNVKWKMERNGTYPNSSKCSPKKLKHTASGILQFLMKRTIIIFGFSKKAKMVNERSALLCPLESITYQKLT